MKILPNSHPDYQPPAITDREGLVTGANLGLKRYGKTDGKSVTRGEQIISSILSFFDDPKNQREFEAWQRERSQA